MTDIKSKSQRSKNMSNIKGKNTKPEFAVRKYLTSKGIKYRCNVKDLPGKPDISIKKYKTAIFVNGCFWHAHENCKDFKTPKSNINFWNEKLNSNVARDLKNIKTLQQSGYKTFIIWECEIKAKNFSSIKSAITAINTAKNISINNPVHFKYKNL